MCRSYRNRTTDDLRAPRMLSCLTNKHPKSTVGDSAYFRGTVTNASLAAHLRQDLARKDDLEMWMYMIVGFA